MLPPRPLAFPPEGTGWLTGPGEAVKKGAAGIHDSVLLVPGICPFLLNSRETTAIFDADLE
jgi:hypothetical protein